MQECISSTLFSANQNQKNSKNKKRLTKKAKEWEYEGKREKSEIRNGQLVTGVQRLGLIAFLSPINHVFQVAVIGFSEKNSQWLKEIPVSVLRPSAFFLM